mmetsp:Transcript_28944/g.33309  ORF Transcript_28944/g.33309 Transcript_28944/m.33309 type:complete len:475 (+) Transcript_28944:125-1549(+)
MSNSNNSNRLIHSESDGHSQRSYQQHPSLPGMNLSNQQQMQLQDQVRRARASEASDGAQNMLAALRGEKASTMHQAHQQALLAATSSQSGLINSSWQAAASFLRQQQEIRQQQQEIRQQRAILQAAAAEAAAEAAESANVNYNHSVNPQHQQLLLQLQCLQQKSNYPYNSSHSGQSQASNQQQQQLLLQLQQQMQKSSQQGSFSDENSVSQSGPQNRGERSLMDGIHKIETKTISGKTMNKANDTLKKTENAKNEQNNKDNAVQRPTTFPCSARGMPDGHNSKTAYFVIPKGVKHGEELICSFPVCRNSGVKFRFCTHCNIPVAKRNFRKTHLHNNTCVLVDSDDSHSSGDETESHAPNENLLENISPKKSELLDTGKKIPASIANLPAPRLDQAGVKRKLEVDSHAFVDKTEKVVKKQQQRNEANNEFLKVDEKRQRRWESLLLQRPPTSDNEGLSAWLLKILDASDTNTNRS